MGREDLSQGQNWGTSILCLLWSFAKRAVADEGLSHSPGEVNQAYRECLTVLRIGHELRPFHTEQNDVESVLGLTEHGRKESSTKRRRMQHLEPGYPTAYGAS